MLMLLTSFCTLLPMPFLGIIDEEAMAKAKE